MFTVCIHYIIKREYFNIIFVMEKKHNERLLERFPNEMKNKKIVVLEIQDVYKYNGYRAY